MTNRVSNTPFVSIVILNYNGVRLLGDVLDKCLLSVFQTDYPSFEVIFVDNGSDDESVKYVERSFGEDPRLRIIALNQNYGFAQGNNIGVSLAQARAEYIVFLNNDTEVEPSWLKNLTRSLKNNQHAAITQPKILSMNNKSLLFGAEGYLDPLGICHERSKGKRNARQFSLPIEVSYVEGAALMIRKDTFLRVGGFDPDFFAIYEDIDLCWRVKLSGYKIIYAPSSVIYHKGGKTTGDMRNRVFHQEKNRISTLIKNYEFKNFVKFLPPLLLILCIRILVTIILRQKYSLDLVKAIFWNIYYFTNMWNKRLQVQRVLRCVPDAEIMKIMIHPSLTCLWRKQIEDKG